MSVIRLRCHAILQLQLQHLQPRELQLLSRGISQSLCVGFEDAAKIARYERLQRAKGHAIGNLARECDSASQPSQQGVLEMVDTFVRGVPTGSEMGLATAVEIGGSTVRALPVSFQGRGRPCQMIIPADECALSVSKAQKRLPADQLFDLVAKHAISVEMAAEAAETERYTEQMLGDRKSRHGGDMSEEQVHRLAARAFGTEPKRAVPLTPTALVFSFPAHQRSLHSAVATRLDKGWKTPGLLGSDVVDLYQAATERALSAARSRSGMTSDGVTSATVPPRPPLVNDCVGTLVLGAYHSEDCRIAVILGTGTNAALFVPRARLWQASARATEGTCTEESTYRTAQNRELALEFARNSPSDTGAQAVAEAVWEDEEGDPEEMCGINTEWASFRDASLLPWSHFDDAIERDFELGNKHPPRRLQSLVSGRYLGEICRRALQAASAEGELFPGCVCSSGSALHPATRWDGHGDAPFSTAAAFSVVHQDPSTDAGRGRIAGVLQQATGQSSVTSADCLAVHAVCAAVVRRAARVVAAGIVACAQASQLRVDGRLPRRFTVELDGSVYTHNRVFGQEQSRSGMDGVPSEVLVGKNTGESSVYSGPATRPGMDRLILEAIAQHPDVPAGSVVGVCTHREASAQGSALVALRERNAGGAPWLRQRHATSDGRQQLWKPQQSMQRQFHESLGL